MRQRPPAILRRVVGACLPSEDERSVLQDLDVLYDRRVESGGRTRAAVWYARQAIGFLTRVGIGRFVVFIADPDGVRGEIAQSARGLARRPAFALAFTFTLAVGTSVLSTVYAAARWVLLRPVPHVAKPNELMTLRLTQTGAPPQVAFEISDPDVRVLRERLPSRGALAAILAIEVDVSQKNHEPRRVPGEMVSANFFTVLGSPLIAGRSFVASEDREIAGVPAAIISAELARTLTGAASLAVGTDIRINGHSVRVIGVAPDGFRGEELPGKAQIWLPLSTLPIIDPSANPGTAFDASAGIWRKLIFRAPRGMPPSVVERAANDVVAAVRRESRRHSYPATDQFFRVFDGIGLDPSVRASVERTLILLGGASALLLLLVIANLANLTFVRATVTSTATAIRFALGASRGRIVRAILVDAAVLGVVGGGAAVLLALVWSRWYRSTQLAERGASLSGLNVDPVAFGVAVGVAVLASVGAFLKPAWTTRVASLATRLRRGNTGAPSQRFRLGLVAVQVALTIVLLVGAGLLARTVANLREIDLGFEPDRILTLAMDPHLHSIEGERLGGFAVEFDARAARLPGASGAGLISPSPLRTGFITAAVYRPGIDPRSEMARGNVVVGAGYYVSNGFFRAIGTRTIAGDPRWTADSGVVVLTRATVAKLFPGADPSLAVGRLLPTRGRGPSVARVVAVIEDLRLSSITADPPPGIFLPLASRYPGLSVTALVSSPGRPARLAPAVRGLIRELSPELPTFDVRTARVAVDRQFAERDAMARVATTLGLIGLLLAASGLYGVLATVVAARRREYGIRSAMGAGPRRILTHVIGTGLVPVVLGLTAGLVGAVAVSRLLKSQLFALDRLDPTSYALAIATLLGVAAVACVVPALRASRVSPAEVLRED